MGGLPITLDDVFFFILCESMALPLDYSGWDHFVSGDYRHAIVGIGLGIPLTIVGVSYHWWKPWAKQLQQPAIRWWPLAAIFALVYVCGPRLLQRFRVAWSSPHLVQVEGTISAPGSVVGKASVCPSAVPAVVVAEKDTTNERLQTEIRQLQADFSTASKRADRLSVNLARSDTAKAEWQRDYSDVVAKIAGPEFAKKLTDAQDAVETDTLAVMDADAALEAYQARYEKKLVPNPPMSTAAASREAHARLLTDKQTLVQLSSQWQAILASLPTRNVPK
jgi:hypothetical protein